MERDSEMAAAGAVDPFQGEFEPVHYTYCVNKTSSDFVHLDNSVRPLGSVAGCPEKGAASKLRCLCRKSAQIVTQNLNNFELQRSWKDHSRVPPILVLAKHLRIGMRYWMLSAA